LIIALDMKKAQSELIKKFGSGQNIENLVVDTHGSYENFMVVGTEKHGKTLQPYGVNNAKLNSYKNNRLRADSASKLQLDALKEIGKKLIDEGNLLLLSCSLAKGEEGQKFLMSLGEIWQNRFTIYASDAFVDGSLLIMAFRSENLVSHKMEPHYAIRLNTNPLVRRNINVQYYGHLYTNRNVVGFFKLIKKRLLKLDNLSIIKSGGFYEYKYSNANSANMSRY
jgi:hypothetical protein